MPIISSVFAVGTPQKDGRSWVRETHTDNLGLKRTADYLAVAGADYAAIMTARAPQIAEQIAEQEFLDVMQIKAKPTLNYNTGAQFCTRLRAAYQGATQQQACQLSYWIIERILAGDLTDAQFATAFGLTQAQWTTLKANVLTPQHDHWAAVLAAQGQ